MNKKWGIAFASLVIIVVMLAALNFVGLTIGPFHGGDNPVTIRVGPASAEASISPDYIVDGVADDVQAQAALNALPSGGGKLVFEVFNYNFTATVSRAIGEVVIEGLGDGTNFSYNGADAIFSAGAQAGWIFREFSTDAGGVNVATASKYRIENVTVSTTYYPASVRAASLMIAASDAPEKAQSQADYVCDGTADDVEIQAAVDALAATGGGEIRLSSGTFTLATKVDMEDDINLVGMGHSTVVDNQGATYALSFEGAYDGVTTLTANAAPYAVTLSVASTAVMNEGDIAYFGTALVYECVEIESAGGTTVNLYTPVGENLTSGDTMEVMNPIAHCVIHDVRFVNGKGLYFYKSSDIEVYGCYFYGVDYPLNSLNGAAVRGLHFHDNTMKSCTGRAITFFNYASDCEANNNYILDNQWQGIQCAQAAHIYIHHNTIIGAADIGIYAQKTKDVLIESNDIRGCYISDSLVADAVSDGDSYSCVKVRIIDNYITDGAGAGILVKSRGTELRRASDFQIIGNKVIRNGENAIVAYAADDGIIANNICDTIIGPTTDSIQVAGNCQHVLVCGNTVIGATDYDLYVYPGPFPATGIRVVDNHFYGDASGPIDPVWLTSTGVVIVENNTGYITENTGNATVLNGNTTVVVNHGLAETPTVVIVSPTLLSNSSSWWVTAIGATQFTINVDADPGAGTATFHWYAKAGQY